MRIERASPRRHPATLEGVTLRPGDAAPPIALPAHDGGTWRLTDHIGVPVLLIFHRHLA
jgi:hypothetical protein